jgi:hypothetical protein
MLASVTKYDAAIEPGKLFTKNLMFSVFAESDQTKLTPDDLDTEGIACLDLLLADLKGNIYPVTRALGGLQFKTQKTVNVDWGSDGTQPPIPLVIVDNRRVELPF